VADMEVGFAPGEDAAAVVNDVVEAVGKAKHMLEHEYFQGSLVPEVGAVLVMMRSVDNLGVSLVWMGVLEYKPDV